MKLKLRAKKRKRRHGGHHHHDARRPQREGDRRGRPGRIRASRSRSSSSRGPRASGSSPTAGCPTCSRPTCSSQPPGCPYTLVERRRFDTIENELALSESGLVDPEHAIERGHLIPVELWIEGELSNAFDPPAPLRYKIRIVEAATGKVRTTLEGLLGGDGTFFADQAALWQRLSQAICAGPTACRAAASCGRGRSRRPRSARPTTRARSPAGTPPTSAARPRSRSIGPATSDSRSRARPHRRRSALPQPGPYALYEVTSGSLHFTLQLPGDRVHLGGRDGHPADARRSLRAPSTRRRGWRPPPTSSGSPRAQRRTRSRSPGPGRRPGCSGTGSWPLARDRLRAHPDAADVTVLGDRRRGQPRPRLSDRPRTTTGT